MTTKLFYAGAAAALLLTGSARGEDTQPATGAQPDVAAHQAMHEAMQHQMATPVAGAQMPELPALPDQASPTATRAHQHAMQVQQQHREAARERAMRRAAQDAAMVRAGTMHRGAPDASHHGGGMMGEAGTQQQGAGMMRTGDMHGGTDGMMPGGGMTGGHTGGAGGMMGGSTAGTGTPTTTSPSTTPSGGGTMMTR